MQANEPVLNSFKQLMQTVAQIYHRNASVEARQEAIEREFEEWASRLKSEDTQEKLDRMFLKLTELLKDLPSETVQSLFENDFQTLQTVETQIKRYVPLKDKELRQALNIAKQAIRKRDGLAEMTNSFPKSVEQFEERFADLRQETKEQLAESSTLPRKQKKKSRQHTLYRLWLAGMGTILALGNVLLAMRAGGLPEATSQASITAGAGCLTAAALKKSNVD